jgi:hypothetical protein
MNGMWKEAVVAYSEVHLPVGTEGYQDTSNES